MADFLFDIAPQTDNICPTARLARLISRQGHDVYYTHTSDSVLTATLLSKGIGRVVFPGDLRWFVPDLALLDCQLEEHELIYRTENIDFLFMTIRHQQEDALRYLRGIRVLNLTPYPCLLGPQSLRCHDFLDRLAEIKESDRQTVIIGLLDNEDNADHDLRPFYRTIRQSGTTHPNYQFVLLTNDNRAEEYLFTLPPNVAVYRQSDLHALLSLCDLALIPQNGQSRSECVWAGVPAIEFSRQEIKRITPQRLEHRIADAAENRDLLLRRQQEVINYYAHEEQRLDAVVRWLTYRAQKTQHS